MRHNLIIWFVLLCASLPLIYPFLQKGYFPTHDGEWAIVRLAEMHREIKDLQIPPRWSGYLNHGYGYPLFLFTYPFPYYLGEVFNILGLGLTNTIKFLFVLSVLGGAATMYLLGNKLWGRWAGVVSAIFYLYAPYRSINLYVRGSQGESLALVFFPLLFYLAHKVTDKFSFKLFFSTSLVFAAFILTHNAMVVLFVPWLFFWVLIKANKRYIFLSLFIGLLLASYFWLPAVLEKKYIALSQTPLANRQEHFLTLQQLFTPKNVSGSIPQVTLGWPYVIISLFGIIYTFINLNHYSSSSAEGRIERFLFVGLFVSIILLLPFSNPIWQLPLLREIDFPWRNLNIVIFFISLLGGWLTTQRFGKVIAIVFVILAIVTEIGNIKTGQRIFREDAYYETNDATTTSADELMPIWVQDKPTNFPKSLVKTVHQEALIAKNTSNRFEAFIQLRSPEELVILNKVFFPGWKVLLNGKEIPVEPEPKTGLISFILPNEPGELVAVFTNTPIRSIADMISIVGLISLTGLWICSKKFFHF